MYRLEYRHPEEAAWQSLPGIYNKAGADYMLRLWSESGTPTPWVNYRMVSA